jgi:hypothetical protein
MAAPPCGAGTAPSGPNPNLSGAAVEVRGDFNVLINAFSGGVFNSSGFESCDGVEQGIHGDVFFSLDRQQFSPHYR